MKRFGGVVSGDQARVALRMMAAQAGLAL